MKKLLTILIFSIILSDILIDDNIIYASDIYNKSTTVKPTNDDFAKFADKFINEEMKENNVPGVILSVVKDGDIIFEKGYGYSDLEKNTPVDPNKTLFSIGSVTKNFTAIAVMQLVQENKLDINTDINNYLSEFKIKNPYKEKITMKNLLTHTAGFDETIFNTLKNPTPLSLKEYLKNYQPKVIRTPGTIASYSNYGIALAGYIVEEISGMPYEDYIKKNILNKLNMTNTYCKIDNEPAINLSKAYDFNSSLVEYSAIPDGPAGNIVSTANDMSKLLLFHLNANSNTNLQILNKKNLDTLHTSQFSYYPNTLGIGYGMYEQLVNNNKVISHGGSVNGFISMLSFSPEENIGFFISTNSYNGYVLNNKFTEEFYKFWNINKSKLKDLEYSTDIISNIKNFAGSYYDVRRPSKSIGLISLITYKPNRVSILNNNSLIINTELDDNKVYTRVSENFFKNDDDSSYLFFNKNNDGSYYHVTNDGALSTYEKVPIYKSPLISFIILIISSIIFLFFIVFRILQRIRKKVLLSYTKKLEILIYTINLLFIIAILVLLTIFQNASLNTIIIPAYIILTLPLLSLIIFLVYLFVHIKNKEKLNYIFISTYIVHLLMLYNLNLIGYNIY